MLLFSNKDLLGVNRKKIEEKVYGSVQDLPCPIRCSPYIHCCLFLCIRFNGRITVWWWFYCFRLSWRKQLWRAIIYDTLTRLLSTSTVLFCQFIWKSSNEYLAHTVCGHTIVFVLFKTKLTNNDTPINNINNRLFDLDRDRNKQKKQQ